MADHQLLGDHASHGDAYHVGAFDMDGIEETCGIGRHVTQQVRSLNRAAQHLGLHERRNVRDAGLIEFGRQPDVAIVKADDPIAMGCEFWQNASSQSIICPPRPATSNIGGADGSPNVS